MKELRNFVGGKWTDTAAGKRADLIDPSTGEVFASAPVSDARITVAANGS